MTIFTRSARRASLFVALCLAACAALANPEVAPLWDGYTRIRDAYPEGPGRVQACAEGTSLNSAMRLCHGHKFPYAPSTASRVLTYQQVLDAQFTAPAGYRAVAVGLLPRYAEGSRSALDGEFMAYRLIALTPAAPLAASSASTSDPTPAKP
jgi:hypothetical protein